MTRTLTLQPAPPPGPVTERLTVWGLSARQLQDAYWHARGVQCIRRGEWQTLPRAAELFLLIEPGQLVRFDLGKLTDRLVWRKAVVTRLRIVDQEDDHYSERVIANERGLVERIERWYRPRTRSCFRVVLTASRRIGRMWMAASTRREGWNKIRRSVSWSRLDHVHCPGGCFTEGDTAQERALISRLVVCWPDPAQAIDGVEQAAQGVWKIAGATVPKDAILIEPLWLGHGGVPDENACLIGPAWVADRSLPEGQVLGRARVRDINDVELPEAPKDQGGSAKTDFGYPFAKRTFDIVVSLVVLLVALPLFAIVALCIVLEDGRPVFYGHVRQSQGGRSFRCWKFRSMYRNADRLTPRLAEKNICDGPQVFIKQDSRVTRFGHILRRFEIDEFPQFWNVLIGDMSVVGPRPSPDEENQYSPAWRDLRLSVRPGITGLWQLERTRAPGEDFQEWIKYDIEYVRRASFWFDFGLCAKTAWVLLLGKRA